MFTKGEIIVRDDLKYPDGAVVVDGLDIRGRLLVHPLGGALQFALPLPEIGRFQSVEPAEQIPVFSAGTFYLEAIEGEFEGWSDGSSWNGWKKPCCTREVAERILAASGYGWSHDAATDEFTVVTSEGDETELFSGQTIQVGDGGFNTAYFVGAGSYIWDNTVLKGVRSLPLKFHRGHTAIIGKKAHAITPPPVRPVLRSVLAGAARMRNGVSMGSVTAVRDACPDGTLHLPLRPDLRGNRVRVRGQARSGFLCGKEPSRTARHHAESPRPQSIPWPQRSPGLAARGA